MEISKLLEKLEISFTDSTGTHVEYHEKTALHLPVSDKTFTKKDVEDILKILPRISHDKNTHPDTKNDFNKTILQIAVAYRLKDVVDYFIAKKSNINAVIHLFVEYEFLRFLECSDERYSFGKVDSEALNMEIESASFLEWLISKKFDIDYKNEKNQSALHLAIKRNLQHILPVFLKHTDNIDFVDEESKTLLHLFFENNTTRGFDNSNISKNWYINRYAIDIVKILLERGVSADSEDKFKVTPIQMAIKKQTNVGILEMLVERCTKIHQKDKDGQTLLQIAVKYYSLASEDMERYLKILRSIVAKGANIHDLKEPDKDGYTPFCYAVAYKDMQFIDFLRENNADDFRVLTKTKETLLHILAQSADYDAETSLFELLISKGCQLNAKDENGNTPLHYSFSFESLENILIAKKLIEHGAGVNCRNNQGETPLYFALETTDINKIKFLLELGANVNAKDLKGQTPLHKIVMKPNRFYNLLSLLLQYGADVNAKDLEDRSVLSLARLEYSKDFGDYRSHVVMILIQHFIKLKAADLPWDNTIETCVEDVRRLARFNYNTEQHYKECLKEIDKFKINFIDKHASIYRLLHMNPSKRCAFLNNEKLQQLIKSSKLEKQFPNYFVLILASYHEAMTRKALLEPSKEAWLELTNIVLPDPCTECIFSFLSNSELFNIIETD